MTPTTAAAGSPGHPGAPARGAVARRDTSRGLRELDPRVLSAMLWWLVFASVWVWLGFALFAWGITESNARTVGVTESVVASLGTTPRQFLFAFAITVVVAWFVPHVASGRTRRSLVTASAVAVLVMAAVYAALLTIAFQLERPVYAERGWPLDTPTGHLFTSSDQIGLVLVESFAIAAAIGLGGLAVGAGYRRLGWRRATLALPLTAGPSVLALAALELRESSGIGSALGVTGLPPAATLLVLAVLGALSLFMTYRLVHGAPASPVTSIR